MQQKSSSIYTNPTETPDEEEKRRYNEIGYWQETIRKHEKKEPPAETIEKAIIEPAKELIVKKIGLVRRMMNRLWKLI